jgi:3-phosphoshikimate 1-carboxyvinyltransferase
MGAKLELLGAKGCAPIRISGGNLKGIDYVLPVASAQVKSCILLAGLLAEGPTTVTEPEATRDHTERMLRAMGMKVKTEGKRIALNGSGKDGVRLRAGNWTVPGDFSSAAFWMVAAACREGAEVTIEGVGLNPRRTALLDVLQRMGAIVEVKKQDNLWEPIGTVTVKGQRLKGTEVGGEEIPNLIDEIPILAVAGAMADGKTVIRDAAELRVKESDRVATVAKGLAAMGVKVEERPDGMIVSGGSKIKGGVEIDSFDDHRVAMAMSVLALSSHAPVRITKTWCVATSYPTFWKDLQALTGQHVE